MFVTIIEWILMIAATVVGCLSEPENLLVWTSVDTIWMIITVVSTFVCGVVPLIILQVFGKE